MHLECTPRNKKILSIQFFDYSPIITHLYEKKDVAAEDIYSAAVDVAKDSELIDAVALLKIPADGNTVMVNVFAKDGALQEALENALPTIEINTTVEVETIEDAVRAKETLYQRLAAALDSVLADVELPADTIVTVYDVSEYDMAFLLVFESPV